MAPLPITAATSFTTTLRMLSAWLTPTVIATEFAPGSTVVAR
jgi:hypothetical protein